MAKKRKQGYHHGNLRASLLEAANRFLERGGVAAVTLRALSDSVGVSRSAPYRHFAGKGALLAAIAEDGFRQLRDRLRATVGRDESACLEALERMALAYVDFAVSNPARFRLMFGGQGLPVPAPPSLRREARAALGEVIAAIEACQRLGLLQAGSSLDLANACWATVHGLATLLIDEQLLADRRTRSQHALLVVEGRRSERGIRRLTRLAVRIVLDGMAP
ncbi:MAG: TetR/AcrR family transcriptional regulator [Candidatus Krumholzibacteriota bacterium]|nr:TetR/AcrR family transcriptional regulator [Candidatus Krumholzibacteriota bacterium]